MKFLNILGWKTLWDENVFPWHKEGVNPKLEQRYETLIQAAGKENASQCRFFVPLCGKSVDMIFLLKKGFQVIGCEGVEKPCVDFFEENSIDFTKKDVGDGITMFEAKNMNVKIACGDYFKLTPDILGGKMDCVWDRGSLVAINKSQRPE